jgi:hypothetical protein
MRFKEKKMTAIAVEKNTSEKREKRAKSIAAMGLVNREGDKFRVSTPSLRGRQTSYEVWRNETGRINCNCLEFEEAAVSDSAFRCEHILAVKYALVAKNTESATKQPIEPKTQTEVKAEEVVTEDKIATESREKSKRGEQRSDESPETISVKGRAETNNAPESNQLANTKGEIEMKQEKAKIQETAETEQPTNVLNFRSSTGPST